MERFFNALWKFNAIVIALLGLAGLAAAGIGLIGVVLTLNDHPHREKGGAVPDQAKSDSPLTYGQLIKLSGTRSAYLPLEAPGPAIEGLLDSSGLGRAHAARNLLFLQVDSGQAHWMLPDDHQAVSGVTPLESEGNRSHTLALLCVLGKPDPGEEGGVAAPRRLALVRPDGTGLRTAIPELDQLLGVQVLESNSVSIAYMVKRRARCARIELKTFTVLADTPLPPLPGP